MRSVTGQVVQPAGEGNITLQADQASLVLTCQHTPAIGSNILPPAKTCDTLDYDLYELTCNRWTASCQVSFCQGQLPGYYRHRHILVTHALHQTGLHISHSHVSITHDLQFPIRPGRTSLYEQR
jgi:hypothetical protein